MLQSAQNHELYRMWKVTCLGVRLPRAANTDKGRKTKTFSGQATTATTRYKNGGKRQRFVPIFAYRPWRGALCRVWRSLGVERSQTRDTRGTGTISSLENLVQKYEQQSSSLSLSPRVFLVDVLHITHTCKGWAGEAWSEQQQTGGNGNTDAVGVDTTSTEGYEGWVWNDSSGWYYDEAVAAQQLAAGTRDDKSMAGAETFGGGVVEDPKTATRDVSSSGDESDSDSSDSSSVGEARGGESEGGEGGDKTKQRRRRKKGERKGRLAPRRFPRCKAQRLVDDAEDSVDGARPELLNLSMLGMTRVTSRVYGLDWLKILDLSSNRLSRISPDLAGMECLVDMNLRHNNIGAIPDDFEALTQLRHLRLGYNRLRGFRGNIYLMSSLQTLDLEHNR